MLSLADDTSDKILHPSTTESPVSDPNQLGSYRQYFNSVQQAAHRTLSPNRALLASHGIRLSHKDITNTHELPTDRLHLYTSTKVIVMAVERGASVIIYDVLLGPYIVTISMLNLAERVYNNKESLYRGSFGDIIQLSDKK